MEKKSSFVDLVEKSSTAITEAPALFEHLDTATTKLVLRFEHATTVEEYQTIRANTECFFHKVEFLLVTSHADLLQSAISQLDSIAAAEQAAAKRLAIEQTLLHKERGYPASHALLKFISQLIARHAFLKKELLVPIGTSTLQHIELSFSDEKQKRQRSTILELDANRLLKTRVLSAVRKHTLEQTVTPDTRFAIGLEVNELSCTMLDWTEDFSRTPSCTQEEYDQLRSEFYELIKQAHDLSYRLNAIGREHIADLHQISPEYTEWMKDFSEFQTRWMKFQFNRQGKIENVL